MEVASLQHLNDSFSYGWLKCGAQPSFERLVDADLGHSFGSSRSFIDMDPTELFSMRWTTTAATPASDFDFGLPGGGGPQSTVLVSSSKIFRNGRLLPCEPDGCSGLQEDVDVDNSALRTVDVPRAPRSSPSSPLFHSGQSMPVWCSSARSGAGKNSRPRLLFAGRSGGSSPWKALLRYLRFLMPLYRKVRALWLFAPRPGVSPASPARGSTSSFPSGIEWGHGNADTAVHFAILYCKKSSGQEM